MSKNKDMANLTGDEFRKTVEFFADNGNDYSKKELYNAYVAVTKLYLDELISARLLENLFVRTYGKKASDEFYNAVAQSSDTVTQGDSDISEAKSNKDIISSQFDLLIKVGQEV